MAKKKIRLKKRFKRLLIVLIIIIVGLCFGINRYNLYKYHQTNEYKLLELGYDEKTTSNILGKLSDKQISNLLKEDKKDYLNSIITEKYFLQKNLDKYIEYYTENKDTSFSDIVALVNVGAYRDWYEYSEETDTTKGEAVLVNKFYTLPENYDAGEIKTFSSTYAYGEVSANSVTYDAFINMANAAKTDGVTLILTSGYRTNAKQKAIYDDYKNSRGTDYADAYAARAGSSEHETGYALDIFTYNATMDNFKDTDAYKWLEANAYKYGFILRYAEGKKYITGYNPESWHYRYIGTSLAEKVYKEGITYDEYYAYYLDK